MSDASERCTVCGKDAKGEVCGRRDEKGRQACLISYRRFKRIMREAGVPLEKP
jgi:hypothetical protein